MEHVINILIASRNDEDAKHILISLSEEKNFYIAGIEKNETDTIIKTERLNPDILILDLQLSEANSPEFIRIVRRLSPCTSIIILNEECEYADSEDISIISSIEIHASLAMKAGVSGFLLKRTDINKLAIVIKLVLSGGHYISDSITGKILSAVTFITQLPVQMAEKYPSFFTPVEQCIVTDLANGLSDNEIAKRLNFSQGSIKNILTAIKRNVKLKNRIEIVVFSIVFGLIRWDQLDIYKNNGHFLNDTIQC